MASQYNFSSAGTALAIVLLLNGCSLRQLAVNALGDALARGGDVYASDDDPDLIREALPFGLKTFDSLLDVSPGHQGLLLASAKAYTAYAFLLRDAADRLDDNNLPEAQKLRSRARELYLRGRNHALTALESRHPGFTDGLKTDPGAALAATSAPDAALLYWAGASWASAVSVATNDPALVIDLPLAGALVGRVLELDEHYDAGAAHEFFVSYEASRPGGSVLKARSHYRRALEISAGQRASVYLALAETVAVREQKVAEFHSLITMALAPELQKNPQLRLVNAIARRRALWLEGRIPRLFLEVDEKDTE